MKHIKHINGDILFSYNGELSSADLRYAKLADTNIIGVKFVAPK